MRLAAHQDPDEFRIRKNATRQRRFRRPLYDLEKFRLWRLRQDCLQPIGAPIAAIHVDRILRGKMKTPLGQPSGPFVCDPTVPLQFRGVVPEQESKLH